MADKLLTCTIDSADVGSTLTDFPAVIFLDASSGKNSFDASAVFTELSTSDGWKKLIFTDDGNNKLYAEVELWDVSNSKAIIHIKVPTVSAATDTVVTIDYNSTNADNSAYIGVIGSTPGKSVWNSGFVAVYHMSQDPSVGGACLLDSTTNAFHGTPGGAMTSGDLVDGEFSRALIFDGVDDYISCPISASTNFTFEGVVSPSNYTSGDGIIHVGGDGLVYANDYNCGVRASNVRIKGSLTAINTTVCLAYSFDGTTDLFYEDGVDVGSAHSNAGWGLSNAEIANGYAGRKPPATLSEIRVSNVVRSSDWLKLTSQSLTDSLISLSAGSAVLVRAILSQPYDLLPALLLRVTLEQPYFLTVAQRAILNQLYGFKMLAVLSQFYGDMPRFRAVLSQHYGDNPLLRRVLSQEYGDASRYRQVLDQEWTSFAGLRNILSQRYSISDQQIRNMVAEVYDISERDRIRQLVDQLYVLAAGEAIVQRPDISILATSASETREITSAYNINIEQDEGLFYMTGELQLADQAEFEFFVHLETSVNITIDGFTSYFIPDNPRRQRGGEGNVYIVPLVSQSMLLDSIESDFSVIDDIELGGMAQQLVMYLVAPVALFVDYQLVDWFIPPKKLYSNGDSRMEVIKKIVHAAGGIVQTAPDGTLICRPEYPVSVDKWNHAAPDFELTDQDDFFEIMPQEETRDGYNRFFITDEQLAGDGLRIEDVQISARQRRVKIWMLPWDISKKVILHHSGGSWVTVIDEGVQTSDESEQVEFKAGGSNVGKPVYGDVVVDWLERDLGILEATEEGDLTAAVVENSLARVEYSTKYFSFLVTDDKIEDVQVYPEIVEAGY